MLGLNAKIFERIKSSLVWAAALLVISIGASLIMLHFEQGVPNTQIPDLRDLYWWWLMTITGIGAGLDPITNEGRAIATFIVVIAYILFGLVIAESSIILRMIYTRKEEGNIKIKYKNHIVIFGYTSLTAGVIKLLKKSFGDQIRIVLISNDVEFNPFPGLADFISDNPINHNTFRDANIGSALAAIILANDRFRDPDTYSLAIASGIESSNRTVITIAEMIEPQNRHLFKLTGLDAFLNRQELLEDLLMNNPKPKLIRVIEKESQLVNTGEVNSPVATPVSDSELV